MKEPEHLSCFFADHANGRVTPKPHFITGAAKPNPPKANETVGNLAADNHRKQFGWEGLGVRSEGITGIFTNYGAF
jgi:hypothetical protein